MAEIVTFPRAYPGAVMEQCDCGGDIVVDQDVEAEVPAWLAICDQCAGATVWWVEDGQWFFADIDEDAETHQPLAEVVSIG
jgi:hypothetical protein